MAMTDAERQRKARLRKKYRDAGNTASITLSDRGIDALFDITNTLGISEEMAIETALRFVTSVTFRDSYILLHTSEEYKNTRVREEPKQTITVEGMTVREDEVLKPYTMGDLYDEKKLARQTKPKARDKKVVAKEDGPLSLIALEISEQLISVIRSEMPDFMGGRPISARRWSGSIRSMIEVDNRDPKEMAAILEWVRAHNRFNVRTILGPVKFRDQFDRLAISYRDWVKKDAERKTYQAKKTGGVNPSNKKSRDTVELERKTAEILAAAHKREAEKLQRLREQGRLQDSIEGGDSKVAEAKTATATGPLLIGSTITNVLAQIHAAAKSH